VGALAGLKDLRSLVLSNDCIMCEGVSILAETLSSLGNLQTLDLSTNRIENRGGCALAAALPALSRLTELKLRHTLVGPECDDSESDGPEVAVGDGSMGRCQLASRGCRCSASGIAVFAAIASFS
jgi:hypothetical protein